MKLTKGGTITEELRDIPTRRWWRISFLIPTILFFVIAVLDLFLSEEFTPIFFLFAMMTLLPQLTAYYLRKKSHKLISQGLNLICVGLYAYLYLIEGLFHS